MFAVATPQREALPPAAQSRASRGPTEERMRESFLHPLRRRPGSRGFCGMTYLFQQPLQLFGRDLFVFQQSQDKTLRGPSKQPLQQAAGRLGLCRRTLNDSFVDIGFALNRMP